MKKLFRKTSLVISGVGVLVFGLTTNAYADVIAPTPSYFSSPTLLAIVIGITAVLLACFIMEAKKGDDKGKDEVKEIIDDNLKAEEIPVDAIPVGSAPEKPAEEEEKKEEEKEEKTEE